MKFRKGFRDNLPRVKIDCRKCHEKPCCKMVVVKLDKSEFRAIKKEGGKEYLIMHGLKLYKTTKKNILLGIPAICQSLDESTGICSVWGTRPQVCRRNFLEFTEAGDLLCPKAAIEETGGS